MTNLPTRGIGLVGGVLLATGGLGLVPSLLVLANQFQGFIANIGRYGKR